MARSAVEVQIEVEEATGLATLLAEVVRATLSAENQPDDFGLTLVLTDDARIQALNRTYRQIDSATDVLSFPAREGPAFVTPEGLPPYLGDVVVSYPRAVAQASDAGHDLQKELAILVVHGVLHLLGHDHTDLAEQTRMWARQDEILSALALDS